MADANARTAPLNVPADVIRTAFAVCCCVVAALLVTALLSFVVPLTDSQNALRVGSHSAAARTSPLAGLPLPAPVDPAVIKLVPLDQARLINAAVPFVAGPNPAAKPFKISGSAADREMATTCLTSAAYYEAGPDKIGQEAVVQVVLNRMRHPAFPKTVCGVVFQGSDRGTGCQFTFTCDGALARTPSVEGWRNARKVAQHALAGFVFKSVGTATHYHTDWVVPYWSATLDKLAQVETHIFYRWRGPWGTPTAFSGKYVGNENLDIRLRALADQSKLPALTVEQTTQLAQTVEPAPVPEPQSIAIDGVSPESLKGALVKLANMKTNQFVLDVSNVQFPGHFAIAALNLCANRNQCEVAGWTKDGATSAQLPLSAAVVQHAAFIYEKNRSAGIDRARWNCLQYPRADNAQCMTQTATTEVAALTP